MSHETPAPITEGLQQLRTRYLVQLEERIEHLKKYYTTASQTKLNTEVRLELKTLAHKLAGSGTIFGFPHISQSGQALEQALLEEPECSHDRLLSLLSALLEACLAAKNA